MKTSMRKGPRLCVPIHQSPFEIEVALESPPRRTLARELISPEVVDVDGLVASPDHVPSTPQPFMVASVAGSLESLPTPPVKRTVSAPSEDAFETPSESVTSSPIRPRDGFEVEVALGEKATNVYRRKVLARDEDEELAWVGSGQTVRLLQEPGIKFEMSPLVVEHPQKCFEKYVRRLPVRCAEATDTVWEKLQGRAAEQILGGHVGKLEFFWIHQSGAEGTPDNADGLVCFQFVQGFAANFVRILHLSVVGVDGVWELKLPDVIFQVRQFLLTTLPIDSLRAVVLAGEDDAGKMYFDSDIEVSYQQCRFRWFQLTQSLRRTRNTLTRRAQVRPSSRFLVLHSPRISTDPPAPRCDLSPMPALQLREEEDEAEDGEVFKGFSQF